jgi:hypothetical protein
MLKDIDISKIPVIISLTSLMFWAGAIIRLIFYYNEYYIDITQYLELSEILVLFLSHIIGFICATILGIVITLFIIKRNNLSQEERIEIEIKKKNRLWSYVKDLSIILFIILPSIFLLGFTLFNLDTALTFVFAILVFICVVIIFTELSIKYYKETKNAIPTILVFYIQIFFIMILFIYLMNYFKFESNLKTSKNQQKIIELTDNETITTDSISFIVGKTKNFMFYYSPTERKVIPMTRVKMITVRNYPKQQTKKVEKSTLVDTTVTTITEVPIPQNKK